MGRISVETARRLRRVSTEAENKFWEAIRNRKVAGKKFLRQYPIRFMSDEEYRFFVADFYCAESKLVVELDGKIHERQQERDRERTELINGRGITVVRYKNEEIFDDISGVIKDLVGYFH